MKFKKSTPAIVSRLILFFLFLLGAPLFGAYLADRSIAQFLTFPPRAEPLTSLPRSPLLFWIGILIFAAMTAPFLYRMIKWKWNSIESETDAGVSRRFPWWGWIGLAVLGLSWFLAWSEAEGVQGIRGHTFTPLWASFVVVLNAWTYRRSGRSLLTHEFPLLMLLFGFSALFWWFFEYLNQFVQNWHYHFGSTTEFFYGVRATLAFSTVLPAVTSMQRLLRTYPIFNKALDRGVRIPSLRNNTLIAVIGFVGALSLFLVGLFPLYLFVALWVAPLFLWIAYERYEGLSNPLISDPIRGRWSRVWCYAAAALICGFFWEMWNYHSLSKWVYTVPWVELEGGHLFEMPLPGYLGYLPFGLECGVITWRVREWWYQK